MANEHTHIRLRVTGQLRQGRYLTIVNGVEVLLPCGPWTALLKLIRNRLRGTFGYTPWNEIDDSKVSVHTTIRRLRRDIDAALGPKEGAKLVAHVGRSYYCLGIGPKEIEVEDDLEQLVPAHLPRTLAIDLLDRSQSVSGLSVTCQ